GSKRRSAAAMPGAPTAAGDDDIGLMVGTVTPAAVPVSRHRTIDDGTRSDEHGPRRNIHGGRGRIVHRRWRRDVHRRGRRVVDGRGRCDVDRRRGNDQGRRDHYGPRGPEDSDSTEDLVEDCEGAEAEGGIAGRTGEGDAGEQDHTHQGDRSKAFHGGLLSILVTMTTCLERGFCGGSVLASFPYPYIWGATH